MSRPILALSLAGLLLAAASPAEAAPRKKRAASAQTAPTPKPAAKTPEPEAAPSPTSGGGEAAGGRRGPSRIEFDDRLVQGQTNKANAIYLFERRESALRSLLKKRTNFHDEMDEMLEDELVR
jgi:hypothetical protein